MFEMLVEPSRRFLNGHQMHETFGGLDEILAMNEEFLAALQARMAAWTWNTQVADLFIAFAQKLPAYSAFINRYPRAMSNYDEYVEQNPRYRAALQAQAQAKLPTVGVAILAGHFFIMPVQRIPRYILLLEDLALATPATHEDAKVLPDVLRQMRVVASLVNDAKASAEEASQLAALAHRLRGCPEVRRAPPAYHCSRSRRWCARSDASSRRARSFGAYTRSRVKSSQPSSTLCFSTTSSSLPCRSAATSPMSRTCRSPTSRLLPSLPRTTVDSALLCRRSRVLDTKRDKFVFTIQPRGSSEPLVFLCDSEAERSDWVRSARRFLS